MSMSTTSMRALYRTRPCRRPLFFVLSSQVCCRRRGRQEDGERRALAFLAFDHDASVVRLDDAVRDREAHPHARAVLLGGEERVEDPLAERGRDALTRIADAELERLAADVRQLDLQLATLGHGLDRVLDHVGDRPLDPRRAALGLPG